ncbi:MAG: poly-gamma-glutamate synthase PgsB [Deltaproteobacteria bacterium]|nr:poly-gamma-glutamate synthase PgsB [Deltaproteobacteria bacterium]MCB9478322.1 poly-gamma-glutamate synthase PgsB [Deltaproteobacteria bacterium]MCB9489306.1 poly-gamma-glutamate synthase PgsB [Deltaproteobacteria bacterium]
MMEVLGGLIAVLVVLGVIEAWRIRYHLRRIPIRVHVNGTRGKSSVTRLIAAGLREGGFRTCAKTTGTLPRMIMPDGWEVPVYRPAKANIIEQRRIISVAAANEAKVLVIECMALQPELQWLTEDRFVKATHGVITNARADHLDVMGPGEEDVAWALCGMVPRRGKLYTAEEDWLDVFGKVCDDRKTELIPVTPEEKTQITAADTSGFTYWEHPENIALALKVCQELGVERQTALEGMWKAQPDPGAMTEHEIAFFGRELMFVNGFAANDPESTERIWDMARERYASRSRKILVFNCRSDRPDRSKQLGESYAMWAPADRVVLMGTGTYIFAKYAVKGGVNSEHFVFAEDYPVNEIFELIVGLIGKSGLVMGVGNIGGPGLELVNYFRNRESPREVA